MCGDTGTNRLPPLLSWHGDTILADGRLFEAGDDTFSLLHRSQMLCQVVVLRNDNAGATDQGGRLGALADAIRICLQPIL